MKKMTFNNMNDLKKAMDLFDKFSIEYSWHFLNKKYELHLGNASADQIRSIMENAGFNLPFTWGDYYW
jgi:hypothetical protein